MRSTVLTPEAAPSGAQFSFASDAREARQGAWYDSVETQKALQPDRVFARPGFFWLKT